MPSQEADQRGIGIIRRFLLVMGAVVIGVYVVARIGTEVMSRAALRHFSKAEPMEPTPTSGAPTAASGSCEQYHFRVGPSSQTRSSRRDKRHR